MQASCVPFRYVLDVGDGVDYVYFTVGGVSTALQSRSPFSRRVQEEFLARHRLERGNGIVVFVGFCGTLGIAEFSLGLAKKDVVYTESIYWAGFVRLSKLTGRLSIQTRQERVFWHTSRPETIHKYRVEVDVGDIFHFRLFEEDGSS